MRLEGKVMVVTGAAGGIGRATAERLLEEGGRVVIADLDPSRLEAIAAELGCLWCQLDVTDPESWGLSIESTESQAGGLDLLVLLLQPP